MRNQLRSYVTHVDVYTYIIFNARIHLHLFRVSLATNNECYKLFEGFYFDLIPSLHTRERLFKVTVLFEMKQFSVAKTYKNHLKCGKFLKYIQRISVRNNQIRNWLVLLNKWMRQQHFDFQKSKMYHQF